MKKEAPEQTTVSEKDQYCPCYSYVDGDTDPDCPMHGTARTEKPLSVILDEIEKRAKGAQETDYDSTWKFRHAVSESAADVPALVKALRRAIEAVQIMGDNEHVMIRSDISPAIELQQIAAILNQTA